MIEPLNRVVRSGSVKSNNPSAETKMTGCKKTIKNKISWGCVLLRRSRANSDPSPTSNSASSPNTDERYRASDVCHVSSRTRSDHPPVAVTFNQPHLLSAPVSAVSGYDTDFYDGSPKMCKQSQKFFCDDTVYHRQRNPPPSVSANQFQEDTKIWLDDLARRSKSARDRFNCNIFNEQKSVSNLTCEGGLTVAPRPTPGVKPQSPFEKKPDTKNHEGCLLDCSNIKSTSGSGQAEHGHLHIPYLQRLRPSKSPSLSRAKLEDDDSNSCDSSVRLVSTWSSDTLSLLETENQENGQNSFTDRPLEGEKNMAPCLPAPDSKDN